MSINITDAIFAHAAKNPAAIAIIDAERSITYRSLCHAVTLAARQFQKTGWKTGDIVGISLRRNPTLHFVCALALARMGVIQVSMPISDPSPLKAARIQRLGIRGLVVNHRHDASGFNLATAMPDPAWLTAAPAATVDDIRTPGGDALWIINETSGTTATPKLIGISHYMEDVHRRSQAPIAAHHPGERYMSLSGLRFLVSLKRAVYCLSDGGTLTLQPEQLSTVQLLDWIDRHKVAYITCVPLHLYQLLRDIEGEFPRLPFVRILRSGTAALPPSAIDEIRRRITPNLYVGYGSTETGIITNATPTMLDSNPSTVGVTLEGIELEVVNNTGVPVAAGIPGHMRVRGQGVATSYLQPGKGGRVEAFKDGWFYPGDVAVVDKDGLVFLKGRSDEVMNFDGILVGPAEIESVLRQHPSVKEVAAFALPSRDHQDIPAAAIVSDQPLPLNDLQRFCTERLGIRAPRKLFQFDDIPKNPAGKILRHRVTELAIEQLKKMPRSS